MPDVLDYQLPEHLAARQSAKRREWGVQAVAISLAVFSLAGAGLMIGPINAVRQERQLIIDPESIGKLPADLALLGKLGTFRALVIDWASIRADRLKEEGKYYEALQLHETICALAPRFPTVWMNAAWNMAYNISVAQYSPEARWQWVTNGIRLLRDNGIQINPRAVALYKELAWIYWHKIGDFLDDEHLNYKRCLAVQMESVLGPPPFTFNDEEYLAWFRKIVDAPRDLEALLATDAEVAALVAKLRGVRLSADDTLLAFVAENLRPEVRTADLVMAGGTEGSPDAARMEVLTDPANGPALDRLLAAVRSKVLRERYKFDLDWMLDLMVNQYGPLDWRNAFSHALYWSSIGDRKARDYENLSRNDLLNNARFIFFSLQKMVLRGKISLRPDFKDPFSSYIELTTDTRYIPFLRDAYLKYGKELFGDDPRFREGTPGPIYMAGFVTSMHNWIELLYLEGGERNVKLAEQYLAWLRENNPHPDGSKQEQYLVTLDEFVMGDVINQLQTYRMARAFVASLVQRGLKQLALDLRASGIQSFVRARQAHEIWQHDTRFDINERRQLQEFPILVRDEIETYMMNARMSPLFKVTLWKNLPLLQRQASYDQLRPYFEQLCGMQGPPWDVAKAFPEPPDMEAFRAEALKTVGTPRRDDVEQGTRGKQ